MFWSLLSVVFIGLGLKARLVVAFNFPMTVGTVQIVWKSNIKKTTRNVSETYIPPLVQNSKLLLICTRHYDFRTLYKAELNNQIRVRLHYHDQMAKKLEFLNH